MLKIQQEEEDEHQQLKIIPRFFGLRPQPKILEHILISCDKINFKYSKALRREVKRVLKKFHFLIF